ncbi:class I SAM-dependent methyltransferase [Paenibacillus ginsengarvi]|uniref:class I SAM-dependent methyltransferase n=1 Tax=Paenibacillus ginsengarvi TaxID=400777 RepID=UPI0013156D77|nr:class I SAM-dependent methyltransferase [Paenibacillus ginsengarvi]
MAQYDGFAEQYNQLVKQGGPTGPEAAFRYIETQLGRLADVRGLAICDVGCGQGELSLRLSRSGADVTGVDLSSEQLAIARGESDRVRWVLDDAMELGTLPDEAFDFVVSSVMLMDVSDHAKVFRASHRILKPGGAMIWVIMHPCFQSPFSHPLGDGSRKVLDYREQFWKSGGTGTIRSTLGAYHRPLAMYINDFMGAGFALGRVDELDRLDTSVDVLPAHFAAIGFKLPK